MGTPSVVQNIQVSGSGLTNNMEVTLPTSSNYETKLSSSATWAKSITVTPINGIINETIQVRYNPSTAGSHTDQLAINSLGTTGNILNLSGTATAPYNPAAPTIIVGKIESLIQFPATKTNATSVKVFNIKTTNITNTLSLVVTGKDASMFTVSTNAVTKDAVNAASGTNVNISYQPTAVGLHDATLTISGGGLTPEKVISLKGEGK